MGIHNIYKFWYAQYRLNWAATTACIIDKNLSTYSAGAISAITLDKYSEYGDHMLNAVYD